MFARGEDGGNHLAVVTDVTGLRASVMQRIAAEFGFSETAFLDWRDPDMPHARIFTPTRELDFAGHPLVGSAWVLSMLGPATADRIRCHALEAEIIRSDSEIGVRVPLDQPVHITDPATCVVEMPLRYAITELESPADVGAFDPSSGQSSGQQLNQDEELYVWAWEEPMRSVKVRFFAPGVGVPEDPATGSAAVAFAAALTARGHAEGRLSVHQGDEIGWPSTIHLEWADGFAAISGAVVKDEVRELAY